jgi:hypothetical protein
MRLIKAFIRIARRTAAVRLRIINRVQEIDAGNGG